MDFVVEQGAQEPALHESGLLSILISLDGKLILSYNNRQIYALINLFCMFKFTEPTILCFMEVTMAFRNLSNDELTPFGKRFRSLIDAKSKQDGSSVDSARKIAEQLYDQGLVTVNSRETDDNSEEGIRARAIHSIERKILRHFSLENPADLQGEYIVAYCKFFHCSSDYLLGFTDVMSDDYSIRRICEETGISEGASRTFIDMKADLDSEYEYVRQVTRLTLDFLSFLVSNSETLRGPLVERYNLISRQKEFDKDPYHDDVLAAIEHVRNESPKIFDDHAPVMHMEAATAVQTYFENKGEPRERLEYLMGTFHNYYGSLFTYYKQRHSNFIFSDIFTDLVKDFFDRCLPPSD